MPARIVLKNMHASVLITFRYWMSLTEVSSGRPAVSMRAKSVMKRFPFFLKMR